ncbi:hypothetical protein G5V58_24285 [Nocardioides anomalus]|uniref:Uncharacterized protein n=1 Tax=Nocardioides anomalus TaxID=2712223 RepID=A0A6G6WK54_9ACTN|nr:choice-of-anchor P family protein [Nocardioides anomalus]QIG45450.1 hypothetical protein G5V58_24285 [Nocardioides anomalus]
MRATLRPVAVAAAGLALIATAATAPAAVAAEPHGHHHNQGGKDTTPYAFRAVSYGTRIRGGQLPVSSGTTSYQAIACTNRLGTGKENQVATVELPGLGRLDGVYATTGTSGGGDDVASYSTHTIGSLTLDVPNVLGLKIKAIQASSKAYHDAGGYHADTAVSVAGITLSVAGQDLVSLPIPKPDAPVEVPGLVRISVGKEKKVVTPAGAQAKAEGLVIQVLPTGTKIQVAHTAAKLDTGIRRGLFYGKANATQVKAVGDLVRSGPQPLEVMPCQGTGGETRTKSLASVSVPGVLQVDGAGTAVNGLQTGKKAAGYTTASLARANLLNGALVIDAITARAHVVRGPGGVHADSDGTQIGGVVVQGQSIPVGALEGLEIPGVLRVDTNVVTRTNGGIDVVGVRITLLDGSGAVIDLAHAELKIAGADLPKK